MKLSANKQVFAINLCGNSSNFSRNPTTQFQLWTAFIFFTSRGRLTRRVRPSITSAGATIWTNGCENTVKARVLGFVPSPASGALLLFWLRFGPAIAPSKASSNGSTTAANFALFAIALPSQNHPLSIDSSFICNRTIDSSAIEFFLISNGGKQFVCWLLFPLY